MPSSLEILKKNVRLRRDELGITQEYLAKELGISQPSVSQTLSGGNPTLKTIEDFSRILKCHPWELLKPEGASPTLKEPSVDEALAVIVKALGTKAPKIPNNVSAELIEKLSTLESGELEEIEIQVDRLLKSKVFEHAQEAPPKKKKKLPA